MKKKFCVKKLFKAKKGNAAVSFLLTTAMLLCIFITIITGFIYVNECYNASYLCRKITRDIEVSGEYKQNEVQEMLAEIQNDDLTDLVVDVQANYLVNKKIQLRDNFTVKLSGKYKIKIMQLGSDTFSLALPIKVQVRGMSEVYWK